MQDILVQEIMTTKLVTLCDDQSVTKVAEIFKEESFHHIPIINEEGIIEGMISRTDFERIKYGMSHFRNPNIEKYNEVLFQTILTKDMMTKGIVHLRTTDSIKSAYKIFKKNKFRALPILDKGKLVGLITPLDLLDYFFLTIK